MPSAALFRCKAGYCPPEQKKSGPKYKKIKSFFLCLSPKVNFYHDHTKIILCSQRDEYVLTYINEDRVSKTFNLSSLLTSGCPTDLRQRLVYSLNMLLQRCS